MLLPFLGGLLNCLGGVLFRLWAGSGKTWALILGCVFYASDTYVWACMLRSTAKVSTGSALWSGASVIIFTVLGVLLFHERLTLAQLLGIALIVTGVLLCS